MISIRLTEEQIIDNLDLSEMESLCPDYFVTEFDKTMIICHKTKEMKKQNY